MLKNMKKAKKTPKPSGGIWFWVWLKPRWELVVYLAAEYKELGEVTHEAAWGMYTAGKVASHYHIDEDDHEIRNAYAGMPRGRVAHVGKKWVFYHGDDTPSVLLMGLSKVEIQQVIISRFNLTKQALAGQVEFKFDEHETMQEDDRAIVKKYIGDVPY
jgi:hypothetical protein